MAGTPRPNPGVDPAASAVSATRIAEVREKTARTLGSIAARVQVVADVLPVLSTEKQREAADRLQQLTDRTSALRASVVAEVTENHRSRIASAAKTVFDAVDTIAPTAASAAMSDITWNAQESFAQYLRVGTVSVADETAPALAPALGLTHWYLQADFAEALDLIEATVLRIVAQVPLRHVRIQVVDTRIRGALSALTPLRDAHGLSFPTVITGASGVVDHAAEVLSTAATNAEKTVGAGAREFSELWSQADHREGRVEVVVVLGYPYGINADAQSSLVRLADAGPATGVFLLVAEDAMASAENEVLPSELQRRMSLLRCEQGRWKIPQLPDGLEIAHDGPVPISVINRVVDDAVSAAAQVQGPVFPLAEIIADDIATPWRHSSENSVDARIGRSGRSELVVSLRTANPPTPNLLIGGMVGQGKSNLILDLVYSMATAYSPDELELQLLDFKDGLEFQRFGPDLEGKHWLPHASVLCLESSQEFGLAVLRDVQAEKNHRATLFRSVQASDIGEYRQAQESSLPRLVLVVDEFHKLFIGSDQATEDAVALIDDISRTGRAYGIHLVLASQTTSGIAALASRGEAIFSQFALRMSLRNTPAESQNIFEQGNKAAADLTYRGEVVFNKNSGIDDGASNIVGMSAFVDTDVFSSVQADLWRLSAQTGQPQPPRMFSGRDYARWIPGQLAAHLRDASPNESSEYNAGLSVWLGRPIAITDQPTMVHLDYDAEQAVAIVGDGKDEGRAIITSSLLSAGSALHGGEVVFLDGFGSSLPDWLENTVLILQSRGVTVTHIGPADAAQWIVSTLSARLENPSAADPPLLVVALSPQRFPGMDVAKDTGEEIVYDPITAETVLRSAAITGGVNKVFLIGWWNTLRALTRTLGMSHEGIGAYVVLKVGLDDLREMTGPFATAVTESPRATLVDRNTDGGPVRFVPFGPVLDWVYEEARA